MKFDDQSIWCTCHLISNVNDGYKAMDDIPEEEVISIVEDCIKKPTSSIPLKTKKKFNNDLSPLVPQRLFTHLQVEQQQTHQNNMDINHLV